MFPHSSMSSTPNAVRFWSKVDFDGPLWEGTHCWGWTAFYGAHGYGQVRWNGTTRRSHRVAYELLRGPIPTGLTLDHLCRNRLCVRPLHLEPVTNKENILRGDGLTARQARQTHCMYGHLFDEANTQIDYRGGRRCRTCRQAQGRQRASHSRRQRKGTELT